MLCGINTTYYMYMSTVQDDNNDDLLQLNMKTLNPKIHRYLIRFFLSIAAETAFPW